MKKFLSMLLVLCMIFTTLMGTMVVDVSASVTSSVMTYTITEGTAADYSDRKIVVDMPTESSAAGMTTMIYGDWRINTPYYDASKTDAENEGTFIDIGSFTKYDALGMEFVRFYNPETKSISITDTESKFNYNNSNIYYRFSPDTAVAARKSTEENFASGTPSIAQLTEADVNANVADGKKVAHYSFYAFANSAGGDLTLHFLRDSGSSGISTITVSAADIVSENAVPRKIDVLLYADCGDSDLFDGATYTNVKVYIDGKYYKAVHTTVNAKATFLELRTYLEMKMHQKGTDDVISISSPAKDFYVGFKDAAFEYITRDEASAESFETINYKSYTQAGTVRDNVVTGVNSEIDTELETLFTTTANGTDKTIELYESVYNNPLAIYDTDNSTDSNVVLVDKATGDVYNESNIPAGKTLDDLYISVNGVFVLAKSVADPAFVKNGNDITYTFNGEELKGFDVGNWKLSNGTTKVALGTTSDNTVNAGMTFKKIQLNAGTLSGIVADAAPIQLRTEVYDDVEGSDYLSTDLTYTESDMAQQGFSVEEYNDKVTLVSGTVGVHSDGDGVALYTMYAYSKTATGEPLKINMTANGKDDSNHIVSLPADKLYSKDGVPHKIDIVIYDRAQTNSFNAKGFYRYKVYIDGLLYTCKHGASTNIATASDTVAPTLSLKLTPADGELSWIDTEWYVWAPSKNLTTNYACYSTKGDITDFIFESTVNWETGYTVSGTIKEDVVNGVTADVDAKLNAVLLSKTVDNVIELPESIYNNPVAIFDGTATNVKLIDKVTGVEYTSNIGNKTFDDMYICVEGVYVLVKSIPDADLTYDKINKLASVRANLLSAGTTCRIIVGAYNNDKLADIKVSGELTAEADNAVEYTASDIEEGAEEYRIFVFDALTTIKPLVESITVR